MLQPNYLIHFMPVKQLISIDYIIVGQGLAGSAMAMQLLQKEKKILVVDEPGKNHSSRLAAGLFSPVTGKNSVKTWMADLLFPYLHKYYRQVESLTGTKFFFPMSLYRPFSSVHEQNEWMGKSSDEIYTSYIEKVSAQPLLQDGINDRFGGLMLKQCGYVNTGVYLDAVREYVSARSYFLDHYFDDSDLVVGPEGVTYKGFYASAVIFCQGIRATACRRFGNLPVKPLKGEIIDIKTDWQKDVIINRGVYIVPGNGPGQYRVGSTYKFNDTSAFVTDSGKQELEQKLKDVATFSYEVVSQAWGIRPTTTDRRPLLGNASESDRLIVFNGLGTKGISLAPYFSEILVRWLENAGSLNKDVALARYK